MASVGRLAIVALTQVRAHVEVGHPEQAWLSHSPRMLPTVYILTNKPSGTLYIGVTSNPLARFIQHRSGTGSAFVKKHKLYRVAYIEHFASIREAIVREKRLKMWRRAGKIALIEGDNPHWVDLWPPEERSLHGP